MTPTIRFLSQYLRPNPHAVEVRDTTYERGAETLPARIYRPAGQRGPLPTWIVLHGLTWHGPAHPSLDRFARAVAASGSTVFIPEIPEWRRLRVAPGVTGPSVHAAIDAVCRMGVADPRRIAVLGFSFGATQILTAAAADPTLAARLRAIAAWGGYCDLHRLFHFGVTGEYEHEGVVHRTVPDPYGAWIMGSNYLTLVPGLEDHDDIADALARLASESGRRGIFAGDPVYDDVKRELRATLSPSHREVFDLLAPVSGATPDPTNAKWLARALADAALSADPLLDPNPLLPRVPIRTLLAHGRDDRLVPFTETLRLGAAIPDQCRDSLTVTSLFAHSGLNTAALGPIGLGREAARFARLLQRLLALVRSPE